MTAIQELERQLLQLAPSDKLHIIQFLTQSLITHKTDTPSAQTTKLSEFFRQSPLAEFAEDLDFSRDQSLPRDSLNL